MSTVPENARDVVKAKRGRDGPLAWGLFVRFFRSNVRWETKDTAAVNSAGSFAKTEPGISPGMRVVPSVCVREKNISRPLCKKTSKKKRTRKRE